MGINGSVHRLNEYMVRIFMSLRFLIFKGFLRLMNLAITKPLTYDSYSQKRSKNGSGHFELKIPLFEEIAVSMIHYATYKCEFSTVVPTW